MFHFIYFFFLPTARIYFVKDLQSYISNNLDRRKIVALIMILLISAKSCTYFFFLSSQDLRICEADWPANASSSFKLNVAQPNKLTNFHWFCPSNGGHSINQWQLSCKLGWEVSLGRPWPRWPHIYRWAYWVPTLLIPTQWCPLSSNRNAHLGQTPPTNKHPCPNAASKPITILHKLASGQQNWYFYNKSIRVFSNSDPGMLSIWMHNHIL